MVADDRAGLATRFLRPKHHRQGHHRTHSLELDIPRNLAFRDGRVCLLRSPSLAKQEQTSAVWWEGTTAPTEIPADDVRSALASTDDRIPAIKALRELHPGLGLKDAMDLIDAQRGEQGPHH